MSSGPASVAGRIAYLEIQSKDVPASTAFFEAAFGWRLTSFGPDYAATTSGATDIGIDGHAAVGRPPLAGIEVSDLEAALLAVEGAGGVVTEPIFAFPGGRRFHFREPSGNELSVFVNEGG